MKTARNTRFALIGLLFVLFSACQPKVSKTIEIQNTEKTLTFIINGKQANMFDPWVLTFELAGEVRKAEMAAIESYMAEPSKENIKIEWQSEKKGVITVMQKDGEPQTLPFDFGY
jgi:hypothetical protein